eukprot:scaffold303691_cov39-Prasinocladus_malaysianus.AAC.1
MRWEFGIATLPWDFALFGGRQTMMRGEESTRTVPCRTFSYEYSYLIERTVPSRLEVPGYGVCE